MNDALQSFRAAVLAVLGHAPECIDPGRFQRFATSERRGDSAGWCKLFDDLRGGVFGCYRQGFSETWSAAERATMTLEQRTELARQVMAATAERETQQRQQWAENAQRISQAWAQCVPLVPGDPCTLYLKRRGLGGVWPFESHARRLHASGRRAAVKAARALLHKAQAGALPDPFTARDVYRNQWAGLSERETVAEALDMLAAHAWLNETTADTGGRPTTIYSLAEGARRG